MVKLVATRLLEWPACCTHRERTKHRLFMLAVLSLGLVCMGFA